MNPASHVAYHLPYFGECIQYYMALQVTLQVALQVAL